MDLQANDTSAAHTEPLTLFEAAPEATLQSPPQPSEIAGRRCEQQRERETSPLPALAPELRPRQRMLSAGPEALSAAELLGILLGGDTGRCLRLAQDIIVEVGSLAELRAASYFELTSQDGAALSEAKACTILAAVELGKRMISAHSTERPVVSSPADLHDLLGGRMRDLDREHFVDVLLDTKNQVIGYPTISVGTLSSSLVHPREVFKPAIKASAASVILAHNHPSHQPEPSTEDRAVTRQLAQAGETIGIEVLDHVILGGDRYVSLKEMGLL